MKKINIALMLFVLLSCKKEKEVDYLAHLDAESIEILEFGLLHEDCPFPVHPDCYKIFKREGDQLFEDKYEGGNVITFDSTALDSIKFALTQKIIDLFPKEFIDSSEDKYGERQYSHTANFYIKLKTSELDRIWWIDAYDEDLNKGILDFRNKVEEVLNEF